jgi:hypothetical protein
MLVFCSEIESEDFDDCGFVASNGKRYEYVIEVMRDTLAITDCIGRTVPIDITSIDQIIDALMEARSLMLVPRYPDAFVNMES